VQDFRRLQVWRKSHDLVLAVYESTRRFPKEELYGLTSQMRRAAVSIPANVAEGCCRSGDVEFGRFLQIAMGSASESDYYLVLAPDLGLLGDADARRLASSTAEVKRMLASLLDKVRRDRHR